ncbi:dUTP diphosphatase [Desulforhopalus singaporensis]|uniref:dUTP diphosphatase n=1 Tax=Desulforhopalus singaporensis TaxID=91360 RepID=UPI001C40A731|nr:dUTP diphosphatase [Desulforhopalus singaporensis]
MESKVVLFKWLDPRNGDDLKLPSYETAGSAGMDIEAAVKEPVKVPPGAIRLIPTGFCLAIPEGYEIQVRPRSGIAVKFGVTLINSPGTIDSDYRGEVKVPLINHGTVPFTVNRGDRIAQMVLAPVVVCRFEKVGELAETARGAGGFGHTGV